MTKAFFRKSLLADGHLPYIVLAGSMELAFFADEIDWATEQFDFWQPDELDDDEFNLVMIHKEYGIFIGHSIDFDFTEED